MSNARPYRHMDYDAIGTIIDRAKAAMIADAKSGREPDEANDRIYLEASMERKVRMHEELQRRAARPGNGRKEVA